MSIMQRQDELFRDEIETVERIHHHSDIAITMCHVTRLINQDIVDRHGDGRRTYINDVTMQGYGDVRAILHNIHPFWTIVGDSTNLTSSEVMLRKDEIVDAITLKDVLDIQRIDQLMRSIAPNARCTARASTNGKYVHIPISGLIDREHIDLLLLAWGGFASPVKWDSDFIERITPSPYGCRLMCPMKKTIQVDICRLRNILFHIKVYGLSTNLQNAIVHYFNTMYKGNAK